MGRHYKLGTTSWTTVGILAAILSGASWFVSAIASLLVMTSYVLMFLAAPLGLMAWALAISGLVCGILARQQKDRYAWIGITLALIFMVVSVVSLLISGVLVGLVLFDDLAILPKYYTTGHDPREDPMRNRRSLGYVSCGADCPDHDRPTEPDRGTADDGKRLVLRLKLTDIIRQSRTWIPQFDKRNPDPGQRRPSERYSNLVGEVWG